MIRDMPNRDRLTGGAGRESSRVRFGGAGRGMRGQRKTAHFGHSQLQLTPGPSPNRFNRLAGTIVVRVFFFKNRKYAPGLAGGLERQ